jgi:hypothetical protein
MHESINIIGDIAGRYDELMELLAAMPAASLTLAVGDLVDRGPKSRQVVEWFMGDPLSREAVFGNHELMLIEASRDFAFGSHPYWYFNGGNTTMESYNWGAIPEAHLKWLETRPAWYRQDGLFVSHAPVRDVNELPPQYGYNWRDWYGDESTWPWNRYISRRPMPGHFMVYGHNSHHVEHTFIDDEGEMLKYAMCIDNSRHKELMGIHWPSRELFSVDYHE